MDSEQDKFGWRTEQLSNCRGEWLKQFAGVATLIGGTFSYPSMPRPFGPMWSSYVFGYYMAVTETDVWMMSNGLSNPNHHAMDQQWMQSDGLGCELLMRCSLSQIQIGGVSVSQWLDEPAESRKFMDWLDTPEMVILDALCGSVASRFTEFEPTQRLSLKDCCRVQLRYSKYAVLRPMPPDTEFLLTDASEIFNTVPIDLFEGRYAQPLLATPADAVTHGRELPPRDSVLPSPEQAGLVSSSWFDYEDPYLTIDLAEQVKAEITRHGAMVDETLTRRFATYTALTLRSGEPVSKDIAQYMTELDLSSYSTQRQYRESKEEKFYATRLLPDVPLSLFARSVQALLRKLGLDETGVQESDVDEAANWPEHVSDITPVGLLENLTRLDLRGSIVSDLRPLEQLHKLHTLLLADTPVLSLDSLWQKTSLHELQLFNTQVDDLTPLAKLPELRVLYLTGTQVNDISALIDMPRLEELHLSSTGVTDIKPLASVPTLRALMLADMDHRWIFRYWRSCRNYGNYLSVAAQLDI